MLIMAIILSGLLAAYFLMSESIALYIWAGILVLSCCIFTTIIFFCWRKKNITYLYVGTFVYILLLYLAINNIQIGDMKIQTASFQNTSNKPLIKWSA